MRIDIITKEPTYTKLIFNTLLAIIIVIIGFSVIYFAGENLHDYALNNIYSTFLDEDQFYQKVEFSRTHYSSAIYKIDKSHAKYIQVELGSNCIYKISFYSNKKIDYIIISTKNEERTKYLYKIPEKISKDGYNKIVITPIEGAFGFWVKNVKLHEEVDLDKYQDYKIVNYPFKNIKIQISKENLKNISKHRANALARGIVLKEDAVYYPAEITVEGKNNKIQMRLKGDWTDHLNTDKWSFRIKLDEEESVWGMRKFSIQRPEARNGIGEYLIHKLYAQNQGISLSYDFAHVIINDEYWGVYAIEQAFDKIVVESSSKREGPIIKLDESYLWESYAFYSNGKLGFYSYAPFDVFSLSKSVKDEKLYGYSQYGIELLRRYRAGELSPEEVFDMKLYARYLAICDIFQANHALAWHNRRYYFNPITAKLEPISFDMLTMSPDYRPTSSTFKDLFSNKQFSIEYIKAIKDIIDNYDKFLNSLQPKIDEYSYIISTYNYEEQLSEHRKFILETVECDNSKFVIKEDKKLQKYIDVQSNSILLVYITDVLYHGESIIGNCRISTTKLHIDDIDRYDLNAIEVQYLTLFDQEINKKHLDISPDIMIGTYE